MSTFLFDKIIFGPVKSRRLGVSLGINLLPTTAKVCSFNCIYCECGFNTPAKGAYIPTRDEVKTELIATLSAMKEANQPLDVITFAGNGEPTIHKDFAGIIDDTIAARDAYFPDVKISVLSNSTQIDKPSVFEALQRVDNNILKLDSAVDTTLRLLNQPGSTTVNAAWFIEHLKKFEGKLIIQTMFLHGKTGGQTIDNTTPEEIGAWLEALQQIKPKQVMIYTLDREAPTQTLQKATHEELTSIAQRIKSQGFDVLIGE
ncbi:radical SAM protein [Microbacter margulisiae]|uniref:Wyosine [tRNA(Phe)-imidazoG37] synthetase (Radical SAM superfamily) n=1 Tax=Microbacter margulisiae TaxID=1350067 RepID=A0A7W5DTG4_9PORP|nr:radical SAM protein [Microbacter margulisiae]MBB3188438.1 wyosine [tRNA(Phe)-imidazoG37] synthetase (radical SAM superfamily) [Microbacter margulisiae]